MCSKNSRECKYTNNVDRGRRGSGDCRDKKVTVVCYICGSTFKVKLSRYQRGNVKYCSRKCMGVAYQKRYIGKNNPKWRGGRTVSQGYTLIYMPSHKFADKDGYVFEHRLVMEKKIGRYLKETEFIHHLNHIKSDNKIDNLKLCFSKSEHLKEHLINGSKNPNWVGGMITLNCKECGKEFKTYKCLIGRSKYCSKTCHWKNLKKGTDGKFI